VHHGDEKTGSTPVLRTMTMWSEALQKHVRIPLVSGNAVRGMLRRRLMRDMLDRLGLDEQNTPKLHHALFSGGLLESTEECTGEVDIAFRKLVRDTIPPIGLFGTAIGNQMIQGSLLVEHAVPVARETSFMAEAGIALVEPDDERWKVSILTRPEGRVQRRTTAPNSTLQSNFPAPLPC